MLSPPASPSRQSTNEGCTVVVDHGASTATMSGPYYDPVLEQQVLEQQDDGVLLLYALSFLDVATLLQKQVVSNRWKELCNKAISAKCKGNRPKAFQSNKELRGVIRDYCKYEPKCMEEIACTYGFPIGTWDVSKVTDFSMAFYNSNFNEPINDWNTSNATTMVCMFRGAHVFNQNIGSWNVSNVTDMSEMFDGAKSFEGGNIGLWDVSNVSNMSKMFYSAWYFRGESIGAWDVSNVTDMSRMFEGAQHFDECIGSWNVDNVIDMHDMFRYAGCFNQDIDSWNVSNVRDMSRMFQYASKFDQYIGSWNVSNVMNMSSMFRYADAFNQCIGTWDVSNVTDMSSMFHGAFAFDQAIGCWDVSRVRTMEKMFYRAKSFNQDIGSWDVSNVLYMDCMFAGAHAFNQPIGAWDISSLVTMKEMFKCAKSFKQDMSSWNVTAVVSYTRAFISVPLMEQSLLPAVWTEDEFKWFDVGLGSSFPMDVCHWETPAILESDEVFEEELQLLVLRQQIIFMTGTLDAQEREFTEHVKRQLAEHEQTLKAEVEELQALVNDFSTLYFSSTEQEQVKTDTTSRESPTIMLARSMSMPAASQDDDVSSPTLPELTTPTPTTASLRTTTWAEVVATGSISALPPSTPPSSTEPTQNTAVPTSPTTPSRATTSRTTTWAEVVATGSIPARRRPPSTPPSSTEPTQNIAVPTSPTSPSRTTTWAEVVATGSIPVRRPSTPPSSTEPTQNAAVPTSPTSPSRTTTWAEVVATGSIPVRRPSTPPSSTEPTQNAAVPTSPTSPSRTTTERIPARRRRPSTPPSSTEPTLTRASVLEAEIQVLTERLAEQDQRHRDTDALLRRYMTEQHLARQERKQKANEMIRQMQQAGRQRRYDSDCSTPPRLLPSPSFPRPPSLNDILRRYI
ncbi:fibronectin domain containing protein [Nitzschia inconspicua]|uniref:Fibronectin domain containing protein n=1 Tax=Nitzschia inconspicua TaxID=303405 RepID=A0A9K3KC26_9STRA|nr:fibronectin domain containing protein [Nitzschia inconspicua]